MKQYQVGDRVLIKFNPHRSGDERILGLVIKVDRGTGFMGCDLYRLRYRSADGVVEELPFGIVNLGDGSTAELIEAAQWHESQAAELRALADTEPPAGDAAGGGSNP